MTSWVISNRLQAPLWEVFDRASDPYWYFPKGLHAEQFDDNYHTEVTIDGDTAWNYTVKKLWKLKGNVFVKNIKGDEFRTDLLYWDQAQAKVYSDEYIEIKQGEMILKGHGFEANQDMTVYRIFKPFDSAIPFNDNPAVPADSLAAETPPETALQTP